jgi:PKHD-type hydroxylase
MSAVRARHVLPYKVCSYRGYYCGLSIHLRGFDSPTDRQVKNGLYKEKNMIWFEPPDQEFSFYYLTPNVFNNENFDNMEKYVSDNIEQLSPASVGNADDLSLDHEYRRSNIMFFKDNQELPDIYSSVVNTVLSVNNIHYKYNLNYIEPLQYSVYESNDQGFYDIHCDNVYARNSSGFMRKISFSILLNDPEEFEGGDLMFHTTTEPFKVSLKKSDMILFPSFVPHSVSPVTKGVRKTLVGWVCGPNFT